MIWKISGCVRRSLRRSALKMPEEERQRLLRKHHMGSFKIRVPQCRPQYTIVLIIGTPKKVPLILGNTHITLNHDELASHKHQKSQPPHAKLQSLEATLFGFFDLHTEMCAGYEDHEGHENQARLHDCKAVGGVQCSKVAASKWFQVLSFLQVLCTQQPLC